MVVNQVAMKLQPPAGESRETAFRGAIIILLNNNVKHICTKGGGKLCGRNLRNSQ